MNQSRLDKLREEIALLKFRLKTARDREILLLTKLIDAEKRIAVLTTRGPHENPRYKTARALAVGDFIR